MTKALVTYATGPHLEFLEIALPSFHDFAEAHGYDVIVGGTECSRPASWHKVPLLRAALDEYDEALWVDADVVITDPAEDMNVPDGFWQALVEHHTGDGDVPNCGVWYVRRPMRPFLDRIWSMTEHLHSGWWEQSAMIDLLGYVDERFDLQGGTTRLASPTKLYERTYWLDAAFNAHPWHVPYPDHVRFAHATMRPDRAAVMREWAAGNDVVLAAADRIQAVRSLA